MLTIMVAKKADKIKLTKLIKVKLNMNINYYKKNLTFLQIIFLHRYNQYFFI